MGLPGLETLLPIVYTHGVLAGRLTPAEFVAKCCTNPAKLMGLYPKKGVIAAGSDADSRSSTPSKRIEVDHAKMETNADWSPYQGWSLAGFAETTFSRGRKIVADYQFIGESGWGRWLPRERAGSLDEPMPADVDRAISPCHASNLIDRERSFRLAGRVAARRGVAHVSGR